MSILSELKKLTGKQNAKVVSEALPDSTGGAFVVSAFVPLGSEEPVLDKTYSEILEAYNAKQVVILHDFERRRTGYLLRVYHDELVGSAGYRAQFFVAANTTSVSNAIWSFGSDTEDGTMAIL